MIIMPDYHLRLIMIITFALCLKINSNWNKLNIFKILFIYLSSDDLFINFVYTKKFYNFN